MPIRAVVPQDAVALIDLSRACGLFEPSELTQLRKMLDDHFEAGESAPSIWLTESDSRRHLLSVAYLEPERMRQGTWNLLLIAVHPDQQRHGHGSTMLRHVETLLTQARHRLLIVETTGVPDFEYVRDFYRSHGYEQEALIRDYYDDGLDKIVFRKLLVAR